MTRDRHQKLCSAINLTGKRKLIKTQNEGGVLETEILSKLGKSISTLTRCGSSGEADSSIVNGRRSKTITRRNKDLEHSKLSDDKLGMINKKNLQENLTGTDQSLKAGGDKKTQLRRIRKGQNLMKNCIF